MSEDDIAASSFPLVTPGASSDVTSTIDGDYYLVTLKTNVVTVSPILSGKPLFLRIKVQTYL